MTIDDLRRAEEAGEIDTVLLAMTDMQGRLQGKRLTAKHFLKEVAHHGAESCNYLLAVDVDMATVDGYAMASWEGGYGDMLLKPDLSTLRPVPWQEGTVMCLADVAWLDGSDVVASPRQILRRQLARLAERGWSANAGTELEFMVFLDTYEEAWHKGYRDLKPANLYNVDYSLLGTARVEPLIRRIRNDMADAGMVVEDSKGECNYGQHEINFHYADALRTADDHAIYKNGAKEIASDEGYALTFMAKYDQREGNSCHIHFSIADDDGPLFHREQGMFESFLAGQVACLQEMTLLLAPNINSYKRYASASLRADDRRMGKGQPHVLAACGRARPLAALREPRRRSGPEPVSGAERNHRLGPSRSRRGPRARTGAGGQRIRRERAPSRAEDDGPGPRAVRRQRGRPGRVRRGCRRALPERGRRGAERIPVGRHRLGALRGFERL